MKGGIKMEAKQHSQIIEKDPVASKILGKYAMWHPEVEEKELCAPCNHCSGAEHCHPCGSSEREKRS